MHCTRIKEVDIDGHYACSLAASVCPLKRSMLETISSEPISPLRVSRA